MSEQTKEKVTCPNAACGKKLIVPHPGKACTQQFTCPSCGKKFKITFNLSGAGREPDTEKLSPAAAAAAAKQSTDKIKDTLRPGGLDPRWTIAMNGCSSGAILRIKMHRRLLPAKETTFNLDGIGSWTIGRLDDDTPSDIQITGDSSISRRCAAIFATPGSLSTTYMLKVIKSKNPIFINQRQMADQESIQLIDGDHIVMGQTSMTFHLK